MFKESGWPLVIDANGAQAIDSLTEVLKTMSGVEVVEAGCSVHTLWQGHAT